MPLLCVRHGENPLESTKRWGKRWDEPFQGEVYWEVALKGALPPRPEIKWFKKLILFVKQGTIRLFKSTFYPLFLLILATGRLLRLFLRLFVDLPRVDKAIYTFSWLTSSPAWTTGIPATRRQCPAAAYPLPVAVYALFDNLLYLLDCWDTRAESGGILRFLSGSVIAGNAWQIENTTNGLLCKPRLHPPMSAWLSPLNIGFLFSVSLDLLRADV